MKGAILLGLALAAIGASGARAASQRAEHTVSWYASHPSDRANVLQQCNDDRSLDGNGDCRNATAAAAQNAMTNNRMIKGSNALDDRYSVQALKANSMLRGMMIGLCRSSRPPSATVCRNAQEAQGQQ